MTAKAIFTAMKKVLPEIAEFVDSYGESRTYKNSILFTRKDKPWETYIFRFNAVNDWSLSTMKGVKK